MQSIKVKLLLQRVPVAPRCIAVQHRRSNISAKPINQVGGLSEVKHKTPHWTWLDTACVSNMEALPASSLDAEDVVASTAEAIFRIRRNITQKPAGFIHNDDKPHKKLIQIPKKVIVFHMQFHQDANSRYLIR